jgi:hypothetical protein
VGSKSTITNVLKAKKHVETGGGRKKVSWVGIGYPGTYISVEEFKVLDSPCRETPKTSDAEKLCENDIDFLYFVCILFSIVL